MFQVVSWHRWRQRLLPLLAAALMVCGVGEAAATLFPTALTTASDASEGVLLPVVMYHGILPQTNRQGTYVISPTLFEQDLQCIRDAGYTTVLMADLLAYVDEGTPLPEKPILLTFDDGYYNNYLYAYPLLQKYNMKAVISPIVTWSAFYSDNPQESNGEIYSHITWEQMREMTASGLVEIQNHSYNLHENKAGHRKGAQKVSTESETVYQGMLREDLAMAQRRLAAEAGVTPTTFVYPFGAMSREALPVLRELGFRATLTCESRINCITRQPDSLWGLGRYLRPTGEDSKTYFNRLFRAVEDKRGA